MSAEDKGKSRKSSSKPRSLLGPPSAPPRPRAHRGSSTQNAMDELLDETFNSDSIEESHSLVGLDESESAPEPKADPDTELPVLAGPTSPEAKAKRYTKLRADKNFWAEIERTDDET